MKNFIKIKLQKTVLFVFFLSSYIYFTVNYFGNNVGIFMFGTIVGIAIMGLYSESRDREDNRRREEEEMKRKDMYRS